MGILEKNKQDTLIISDDVIALIAANAAKEVDGFGSFSSRTPDVISQALPNTSAPKSIKVSCTDSDIQLQLYINVKEGNNAQQISAAVQRAVKISVQSMTGKVVSKVNICVQGIDFCEPGELN